ncbi:hypothetical protein ACG33_12295 [Steroidobacter denitrificans]|uniref:Uncharacterized protein n=1 Tax=Steroidobacter denitrificans TaxID=465721 RepID=A0A127FDU4_STEDE|nr:hypothetical protein ACG33_12295 [Steroidobacter denitrificans]
MILEEIIFDDSWIPSGYFLDDAADSRLDAALLVRFDFSENIRRNRFMTDGVRVCLFAFFSGSTGAEG